MPTTAALNNRCRTARMLTLGALRLTAVWLIAWGLIQIGSRVVYALTLTSFSINPSRLWDMMSVYNDTGQTHGVFRGVPTLAVGFALALLSARLSRWIVAAPSRGCLRCDHPLNTSPDNPSPVCTECGEPA